MYPYEIIFGLTLYDILLGLAAVTAMAVFSFFSARRHFEARYHNFIILNAVVTVVVGYLVSVLFQSVYNWLGGAKLEVTASTGATFLGGLIGGAACFLAFYYGVGHFRFPDGLHLRMMKPTVDVFAVCIPAAHAVGRLGCFFAGCCHGKATHAWYGMDMIYPGYRVIPVQLYESCFLVLLALFLGWRAYRKKQGNLPLYMALYGVWRFFAEYLRGDDRGATVVSFLSPSQLISLLLILGAGIVWLCLYRRKKNADATA